MARKINRNGFGRVGKMANMVNRKGGQTRTRRALGEIRRALGQAGVDRAMKNWGLRTVKGRGRGGSRIAGAKNG